CPADAFKAAGTECRGAAGVCDVAETCDGTSAACASDSFASGGVCRPAAGACDVPESCGGSDPDCPTDAFAAGGTQCGAGSCNPGPPAMVTPGGTCNGTGAS